MRAIFYLWFSLAAGMFVAGAMAFFFRGSLPGNGGVLWLVSSAFIAMSLVFGQWERFGERVGVLRWLLLCCVSTPLAVAGLAMGSLFSL